MKTITATEFSRNVSDYLDSVEFRGEEYSVVRNQRPMHKAGSGRSDRLDEFAERIRASEA